MPGELTGDRVVLVYPFFDEAADKILKDAGSEVVRLPDDRQETIAEALKDADAVILHGPARITAAMIETAPRLRVIGAWGAGIDNIDIAAAQGAGINVVHNAGVGCESMVEWTICSAIACHRLMFVLHQAMAEGTVDWSKRLEPPLGRDLRCSTYGIVGLGYIGRKVAEVVRTSFGADVVAFSRRVRPEAVPAGVTLMSTIDDLCAASDTVSVHCSLDDTTKGLIGRRQFDLVGPAGVVVSCARGGVVVEEDLIAALCAGSLRAAAIDVFDPEPPSQESLRRLQRAPNLIMTPHVAGATELHLRELCTTVAEGVVAALKTSV